MTNATTRNVATVPTAEVGVALGALPELAEEYAARFKMTIVRHWDGRPALAQSDAAELLKKVGELRDEQSRRERAYDDYIAKRARDREAAGATAYTKTFTAGAVRDREATLASADNVSIDPSVRILASGSTRTVARQARDRALEAFDAKLPIREFGEKGWDK